MNVTESYRGQDTILEMINSEYKEAEDLLTWNESCEIVAEKFDIQELHMSAEAARNHKK